MAVFTVYAGELLLMYLTNNHIQTILYLYISTTGSKLSVGIYPLEAS